MCLKTVFKVSKLTESRTAAGMLFQTAGAETEKAYLLVKVRGGVRPMQELEVPEHSALDC